MTPFLGLVAIFGFNFAPLGWAFCNGQLLPIAQNDALFALLGTTYGGDGVSTFALPDLRGRVPIHMGQGPGLSPYTLGQKAGTETTTLTVSQMPQHSHSITASSDAGDTSAPATAFPANTSALDKEYATAVVNQAFMAPTMVGNSGGSQPFSQLQPLLVINYCIALQGIFPSQN